MKKSTKSLLLLATGVGGAGALVAGQAATHNVAHAAEVQRVVVKPGDTTWKIAQDHNTTVKSIVSRNHLSNNGSLIFVNQTLEVKNNEKTNAATIQKSSHSLASQTQTPPKSSFETSSATNYNTQNTTSNQNYGYHRYSVGTDRAAYGQTSYRSNVTGSEAEAKAWIAFHESGGNYNARNGVHYGKYQLDEAYLGGNYSPAHQEQVADNYVRSRYGSWVNAKRFWVAHNWY